MLTLIIIGCQRQTTPLITAGRQHCCILYNLNDRYYGKQQWHNIYNLNSRIVSREKKKKNLTQALTE